MNPICNTVVTYYEFCPGLWSDESQRALIEVWRRSWAKAGWTPVVLCEADIKTHPRYKFFKEHIDAKPCEYGTHYRDATFLRWLGAAHYGALRGLNILLTDYDVISYGFTPRDIYPNELTLFCEPPPTPIFMGSVMGSPRHFEDIMELFVAAKPGPHDWHARLAMHHQDDLQLLKRMFMDNTLTKPDWFVRREGCSLWGHPGWEKAPMTHFAYEMHRQGLVPKAAHIEKLRPF